MNGYIEEMIEGQKVIKVFNHEAAAKEGFTGPQRGLPAGGHPGPGLRRRHDARHGQPQLYQLRHHLLRGRPAGHRRQPAELGDLAAFLQYTRQVSQPITQISQQVNTILSAVAGAERVFEVMEAQPEVDDGQGEAGPGHREPRTAR